MTRGVTGGGKKEPGTSVDHGTKCSGVPKYLSLGELHELVLDGIKAEKSVNTMRAGAPPDSSFTGVISMDPKLLITL